MNTPKRTTDSILEAISAAVENKEIWDANTWIEAAQSLNALMSDEHDVLLKLQQEIAQRKKDLMDAEATASYAKIAAEASDEYRLMQKQKARIERIEQTIALSKYQARLKDAEYRNG